ncbi:MAG: tetratricopeptide repeat protein [Candidatus Hodarchaeales archaeon]|jgi:tetratricopeptide (TPR) repeat protein
MTTINGLFEEYTREGRFHDLIGLLEEKIQESSSQNEQIPLELKLSETFYAIREFKRAKKLTEKIIPIVQKNSDYSLVGNAENLLGKIYRIYQRYPEAIKHYQNAEKAFKLSNNIRGLSKVYHNLGNVYIFLVQFKDAKKYHFKALELARQGGEKSAIASSLLNIGSMFYQSGEIDKALAHFTKACNLFEEIQDIPSLAATYLNLAETSLLRRDYKTASLNSSKAASLYMKQQNKVGHKLALMTLARTKKALGSFDEAIEIFNNIIDLAPTEIQDETLFELGECYLNKNQLNEAQETFEKILELPTGTNQQKGYSLDNLARIAIENKEFEKARRLFTKLLKLLSKMDPRDPDSIASIQGNLSLMYLKTGDIDRAWEFLRQSLNYFKKRKIFDELLTLSNNFRNELILIDDFEHTIYILSEYIIPTVKKTKQYVAENQYHYEIAFLYHLKGDTEKGLRYWKQNHNKKESLKKYTISLLNNPYIDDNTKEKFELQHTSFFDQLFSSNDR